MTVMTIAIWHSKSSCIFFRSSSFPIVYRLHLRVQSKRCIFIRPGHFGSGWSYISSGKLLGVFFLRYETFPPPSGSPVLLLLLFWQHCRLITVHLLPPVKDAVLSGKCHNPWHLDQPWHIQLFPWDRDQFHRLTIHFNFWHRSIDFLLPFCHKNRTLAMEQIVLFTSLLSCHSYCHCLFGHPT